MNLITSAYWQQSPNYTALLLQQYRHRAADLCLTCVCSGESEGQGRANAYLTRRLLQWFRELNWRRLAARPEKRLSALAAPLENTLSRMQRELADCGLLPEGVALSFSGILCAGTDFLLFHCGEQRIYLLNRAFGRGQLQCISDTVAAGQGQVGTNAKEEPLLLRQGILQQDIGLLIATHSLCDCVTEQEIRECLYVEDVLTKEQADRHLRELGREGERQGGRDQAAVLLLTRAAQK